MGKGALLGPDTVSWRVNREAALLAGGGRALLLQVAHPRVAAGVEQHSDYAEDPWGRLYRTLDTTYKILFGVEETSQKASRRLARRHGPVKGTADDGSAYSARDVDLLLWVWATLVDTSLLVYERCFRPLSVPDKERYISEQKLFAHLCGVPEGACPESYAGFRDLFDGTLRDELRVTDSARAVARSIAQPKLPRPLAPALAPNWILSVGLLPPALRQEYGFAWGPRRERLLALSLAALRGAGRVTPRPLRQLPVELVASGRLGSA
jgi:uncharacterized protein (DUF2236 family)